MKPGVQEFSEALDSTQIAYAQEIPLSPDTNFEGVFYHLKSNSSTPKWVGSVKSILDGDVDNVFSAVASGLLLIKSNEHIFAFTFGFGRKLLDLSMIESQFGLRVALNVVRPSHLRSVNTKAFEDLVMSSSVQASREVDFDAFDVDISSDILRAVTGDLEPGSFAKRVTGSDALVLNTDRPLNQVDELCNELFTAYRAEKYKERFAWIDYLQIVRDQEVIRHLENQFLVDLKQPVVPETTHLAAPEVLMWDEVDSFTIAGTRNQTYAQLDLADYLEALGSNRQSLTIELLKQRHVGIRWAKNPDTSDKRWRLYNCFVSEQRYDNTLHVLMEGQWFKVSQDLVSELDEFLGRVTEVSGIFPEAISGQAERTYNEQLPKLNPTKYLCLDGELIRPSAARTPVEFCDILTAEQEMIHVKWKSRSSTLSHLFSQGSISAALFFRDVKFREGIREKISNDTKLSVPEREKWLNLIPEETPNRSKFSVVYVVLANSTRSGWDWLPFFSKLNLMHHGEQIFALGIGLKIARVDVVG